MNKQTGISFKIIAMASILSIISAIIGLIGLYTTGEVAKASGSLYTKNVLRVQYAGQMKDTMQAAAMTLINSNITGRTKEQINAYHEDFLNNVKEFNKAIENLELTNIQSENKKALVQIAKDAGKQYAEKGLNMFNFFKRGDLTGATEYMKKELTPIRRDQMSPAIEKLVNIETSNAKASYNESHKISMLSILIIILAILIGLALSLTLSILITRSITKPVSKIVNNLSDSSNQIGISSTQLSSSSQEIANGAQEQASSIEETTSSMEELSSMVKQNLENTREASLLSEKATEASQSGYDKMTDMLSAMNGISKSTEEIRNVIDVIDDIAFQTNMLALNAAVEAARAGEAGMGFAVVADEVKNLANRSSESAKETSVMIKETLKNVETGLSISKDLSEVFKEILTNSKKVMEMNREVETASGQQDEGISQVNTALIQLDTVVQANASSAEETASAAEELQGQVSNLNEIVNTLYSIVNGKEYISEQQALGLHPTKYKTFSSENKKTIIPKSEKKDSLYKKSGINKSMKERQNDDLLEPEKVETGEHKISFEDDEDYKAD